MKKRILCALLCVAMLAGLSVAALADGLPFTDVPATQWYYQDVETAYNNGLINGKSATRFAPDDNLTYAEAVKLAACMHQKYTTGTVTLKNGDPWYKSYVDYCEMNAIIDKEYRWTAKATRAGYMEIFANALPNLNAVNSVPDGSIPDVPADHEQAESIYKLYRAGILQGVDDAHSCKPDSNIKRSEVAAILTRMMYVNKRQTFTMGEPLKASVSETKLVLEKDTAFTLGCKATGGVEPYTYQWYWAGPDGEYKDMSTLWSGRSNEQTIYSIPNPNYFHQSIKCLVTDKAGTQVWTEEVSFIVTDAADAADQPFQIVRDLPVEITTKSATEQTFTIQVAGGKKEYRYRWYCYIPQENKEYYIDLKTNTWTLYPDQPMQVWVEVRDGVDTKVVSNKVDVKIDSGTMKFAKDLSGTIHVKKMQELTIGVEVTGGTAPYKYEWWMVAPSGIRSQSMSTGSELQLTMWESVSYYVIVTDAEGYKLWSGTVTIVVDDA